MAALAALAVAGLAAGAEPFATASVHFEQNATDGDNEVVFQVKGGDDGLAELTVVAPNGRKIILFSAPDRITLGMRQFRFESPEPRDKASLRAAYPEGEYLFRGKTFSGAAFSGRATLSHRLPEVATIVARGKTIKWRPVAGVSAYILELETEAWSITAQLPASAASFPVPAGLLAAGGKYKLGVGTVGPEGNISFVESTFSMEP